ncbi:MAG: type IV secretory system conjugative DNA transfer family protein, partial [Janthinobacterium lividum]
SALVIVAASLAFQRLQGVTVAPPLSFWCWIPYRLEYGTDPAVRTNLLISGGVPAAFAVLVVGIMIAASFGRRRTLRAARPGQQPPKPIRAASDTHGNADWMPMRDVRKAFSGPNPVYGGVVIGEAYRVDEDTVGKDRVPFDPRNPKTWGMGGKAPLLIDPCEEDATHGAVFAGSGGFKTTAVVIPTLAHWTGSVVAFDPSCQVGGMTEAMRRAMGHTVAFVGPGIGGFNVLDWIDPSDPLAETYVQEVIDRIAGDTGGNAPGGARENEIFKVRGKEMMKCILADLLWSDAPPEQKNLREFRKRVRTPEKKMKGFLADIHANSRSQMASDLAGSLMDVFQETFSGIYSNANSDTEWLSIIPYAEMLSGNDFKTRDLIGGKLSVFVQIPMESLQATPALGRVVIGALLNAVYKADGKLVGRVLFLLDEVYFLGRLKVLETARDAGRKYGITMIPMWQSVGQLMDTWGRNGKAAWFSSLSWRLFAVVDDMETAKEVSESCGRYTILTHTEGTSTGNNSGSGSGSRSTGRTFNTQEAGRDLLSPNEVRERLRKDEQIVFRRTSAPIRMGRAIFFRRPELVAQVGVDRFRKAAE